MEVLRHALLHYNPQLVHNAFKAQPADLPVDYYVWFVYVCTRRVFQPSLCPFVSGETRERYPIEAMRKENFLDVLENWKTLSGGSRRIAPGLLFFPRPRKNTSSRTTCKLSAGISRSFRRKRDLQILAGLMWYQLVCSLGGVFKGVRENSPPVLPKRLRDDWD